MIFMSPERCIKTRCCSSKTCCFTCTHAHTKKIACCMVIFSFRAFARTVIKTSALLNPTLIFDAITIRYRQIIPVPSFTLYSRRYYISIEKVGHLLTLVGWPGTLCFIPCSGIAIHVETTHKRRLQVIAIVSSQRQSHFTINWFFCLGFPRGLCRSSRGCV